MYFVHVTATVFLCTSSLDLWLPGPPVDEVSFFDQYKVRSYIFHSTMCYRFVEPILYIFCRSLWI